MYSLQNFMNNHSQGLYTGAAGVYEVAPKFSIIWTSTNLNPIPTRGRGQILTTISAVALKFSPSLFPLLSQKDI